MTAAEIEQPHTTINSEPDGWEWAIVEVFGHRRHAGKTREEERFGAKMLRIDIPRDGDPDKSGWQTIYYGGSSVFSYSLTDEATVLKMNTPYKPPSRVSIAHYDDVDPQGEGEDTF